MILGLRADADTICQWDFNSAAADGTTATGSLTPAVGAGSAELIGGATGSFVGGIGGDPTGAADDSSWSTTKYPETLYANRTAGPRFMASTVGFHSIRLSWTQQSTSTASRYARLQYTLDGTDFLDFEVITVHHTSSTNLSFDLSGIPGATNNPNFGFQMVAEFESTAANGLPGYIGTTGVYNTGGSIKFEMVTVSGQTIGDDNTPPYVFPQFGDQVLPANSASAPLAFTVLDAEEPATNLVVLKTSSQPAVLPLDGIVVSGAGASRNITLHSGGVAGTSRVTLRVVDSGNKSASFAFDATVLPANSAPTVSGLAFRHTLMDTPVNSIPFTAQDAETAASALTVSATSLDASLVPPGGLILSGSGTNRALSITPASGKCGVAPIRVTVSDGENTTPATFPLMVLPAANLLFFEPFDYADGSATTNSGSLWGHRSGVRGDCVISNSMLRLSDDCGEDISAQLISGPFDPGTGAVLFVSFKLRASSLPKVVPDCFAHFLTGGTLVGKISIGTTGAVETCYRVFAGNGPNEVPVSFPMSMNSGVVYRIVAKFDVDTARTTLWVNPADEQSASVTATDAQTPGRVSSFNFRQSTGIGPELFIDDLRAGRSFASVTDPSAGRPTLVIASQQGKVRLSWSNPLHILQAAPSPGGTFTNIPGAASPWETPTSAGKLFFRLKAN